MACAIVQRTAAELACPELTAAAPVPVQIVVYAKDLDRLASFYASALGLAVAERSRTFVVLHGEGLEVAIVAMPAEVAAGIPLRSPPVPLEDTPIKVSFLVPSIEACRSVVAGAGGQLKPPEAAWVWRAQVHLDGVDPEGNVFQLRQLQA
ncbi:MAG: hypothetical protein HYZ20_02545 [Burkholderiales bacterium]|nr:hypothetical protein [Burkholderiales bacterium]